MTSKSNQKPRQQTQHQEKLLDNNLKISPFITKTYKILQNNAYSEIVAWTKNGDSFEIKNEMRFQNEVLPVYFKHSNIVSFVRQLNMYGFKKQRQMHLINLINDQNKNIYVKRTAGQEFFHPYFKKGVSYNLLKISRQSESSQLFKCQYEQLGHNVDHLQQELMTQQTVINQQQDQIREINDHLQEVKNENQAIWRQLMRSQEKIEKKIEKFEYVILSLINPNYMNQELNKIKPLKNDESSFEEKGQQKIYDIFDNQNFFGNLIDFIEKNNQKKLSEIQNRIEYPAQKKVKKGFQFDDVKSDNNSDYYPKGPFVRPAERKNSIPELMISDKAFIFDLAKQEKSEDEMNKSIDQNSFLNSLDEFNC